MNGETISKYYSKLYTETISNNKNLKLSKHFELFIILVRIAEIESEDQLYREFLNQIRDENETVKYLFYQTEDKVQQKYFFDTLTELLKNYYRKYNTLENIIQKKYTASLYLEIRKKLEECKIEDALFTQESPKILESEYFKKILDIIDNYNGTQKIILTNEKCLKFIESARQSNSEWKEKYVEIVEAIIEFFNEKREEEMADIQKYNLIQDYDISIEGYFAITYYKGRYISEYERSKYSFCKSLKLELLYSMLKVIENEKISCDRCLEFKRELASFLKSVDKDIFKNKSSQLIIESIKKFQEHLKKEHRYISVEEFESYFDKVFWTIHILVLISCIIFFLMLYIEKGVFSIVRLQIIGVVVCGYYSYYILIPIVKSVAKRKEITLYDYMGNKEI